MIGEREKVRSKVFALFAFFCTFAEAKSDDYDNREHINHRLQKHWRREAGAIGGDKLLYGRQRRGKDKHPRCGALPRPGTLDADASRQPSGMPRQGGIHRRRLVS